MWSYLGLSKGGDGANSAAASEAKRALPASWYHSPAMYELERRAIFSKRWILITHKIRFQKAGDYISFTQAGFPFFLIMDRDGQVNGFHNICRHRAFPIVPGSGHGNAPILSCKYHGWSYGFKGNLAKAPRFDTVPDFDKTQHNLFPVHTHVDGRGFIWVNLEAGPEPSIPWSADFEGLDTQPRLVAYDLFNDYQFDHTWEMDGDYNWKTLADNYNECYHCPTGHPGVLAVSDLTSYRVETVGGQIVHYNKNKSDSAMELASQYVFPNACFTVTPDFFYIMRCVPVSATSVKMEYDVFRQKRASDEAFTRIDGFFKQVLKEDKDLCNGAQGNLNGGVFTNGQLHPEKEMGPLFFQDFVRKAVMEHREMEEREAGGKPVWPATPKVHNTAATAKLAEEEAFCAGLEGPGCPGSQAELAW
ncbi:rieske family domain-containing protein [Plectosphaerella plurivora]|uniref:Choline monooxygenase, chloroplastic n=1 Tax=Plectosphaerella plurivora TaxID=936078 RepID=A0A9P8VJV4_9PEZI|nr:rieske family domain-containing protein [Plectosphaerella plurivora]